jgi:hypothetical protein
VRHQACGRWRRQRLRQGYGTRTRQQQQQCQQQIPGVTDHGQGAGEAHTRKCLYTLMSPKPWSTRKISRLSDKVAAGLVLDGRPWRGARAEWLSVEDFSTQCLHGVLDALRASGQVGQRFDQSSACISRAVCVPWHRVAVPRHHRCIHACIKANFVTCQMVSAMDWY